MALRSPSCFGLQSATKKTVTSFLSYVTDKEAEKLSAGNTPNKHRESGQIGNR